MKLLSVKMVLLFNLALAVLCVVQWSRETRLLGENAVIAKADHAKAETIVKLEDTVKKWEAEIARLDTRVQELLVVEKTNTLQIGALGRDLKRADNAKLTLDRQIASYKEAVERQNDNIRQQNESIARHNEVIRDQNESLRKIAEERNQLVTVVNERTTALNDTVNKFNAFVAQVEQAQAAAKEQKK